jgi:hypothetical protein
MPGQILETSRQGDLQPLVASGGGVPVFQTLMQIRAELRSALSDEHALLFAEPNADPVNGDIQWYAPVSGNKAQLKELQAAELSAARAKIAQLVTDITNHAETLGKSTNGISRSMADNLVRAIEIPDENRIYMVGQQPVLAGWGHVPRGPAVEGQLLQKIAAEVHAEQAPKVEQIPESAPSEPSTDVPNSGRAATDTAAPAELLSEAGRFQLQVSRTTFASIPAAVAERLTWLSALMWLIFVVLLLGIGYLLLKNCAIALPGTADLRRAIFNYCEAPSVLASKARQTTLLDKLTELEDKLRLKRNMCSAQTPDRRTETKDIVRDRGGKIGAVNVILRWETADDLDLYVRCPNQSEINFSQPRGCGGTLDVDANVDAPIPTPAENITWPKDAAAGEYVVNVHRYKKRTDSPETSFTASLLIDGQEVEVHPGTVGDAKKRIFTFTLPYIKQ